MHHNVYMLPLPSGQILAARRVLSGERHGRTVAAEPLMCFYALRLAEQVGEEISPGHLRGRPLADGHRYATFMAHRGSLSLVPGEPAFRLNATMVAEVQAYFARTRP